MASDGNGAVLPPSILPVRATPEDADTFIGIHEEVARWLWDRGIPQWEPGTFQRAWILGPIKRGELYLAKRGDDALGAVIVQWSDVSTWGKRPPDAGYIHPLRVRRRAAGQGLGRALLRWAEEYAALAGKSSLRLECRADVAGLRRYYERAGYLYRGDVWVHERAQARYEMPLRVEDANR